MHLPTDRSFGKQIVPTETNGHMVHNNFRCISFFRLEPEVLSSAMIFLTLMLQSTKNFTGSCNGLLLLKNYRKLQIIFTA